MDSADLKKKKVLIIDDEADNLEIAQARIKSGGYNTLTLESGEKAKEVVNTERPNLILLDIMMPRKNGYKICKELKADASTSDIPVIVFTADYQDEGLIRARAKEAGADDYILKPFDARVLLAKIKFLAR